MNRSIEKVLTYLAGKENIEDVSVGELQNLAAENPYFPVTQFLLARKLKNDKDPSYSSQVQKTALYYSNHYWLNYLLSEEDLGVEADKTTLLTAEKSLTTGPSAMEVLRDNPAVSSAEVTAAVHQNTKNRAHRIEADTGQENRKSEPVMSGAAEIKISDTIQVGITQADEEMAATALDTNEVAETFSDELQPTTTAFGKWPLFENLPLPAQIDFKELKEKAIRTTPLIDEPGEEYIEDTEPFPERGRRHILDDEHDRMFQNIKAMLDATSEDADADTKNAVINIDPYYTIDYFASQGIKLELEKHPEDQLGQHLKKFTHWLKHMKKLGPEDATEAINRTHSEADIRQIADTSNTVREVVTEAMAQVLEKQGKKDKAIELYNKLSFLNPDKSTYFADKIKKLKGF